MCDINMADLVPNEPPKGLADWCNKKRKVNLLIYKVGYYYEPLEDRNKSVLNVNVPLAEQLQCKNTQN